MALTLPAEARADIANDPAPAARKRLIVAWARERSTGRLTYVGELPRERTGLKCDCECYACSEQLEAVNAGVRNAIRKPHFRHLRHTPTHRCSILVARAVLLHQLGDARIERLPARRVSGTFKGLYGGVYTRDRYFPETAARVLSHTIVDEARAVLTLDDGRQVLVECNV